MRFALLLLLATAASGCATIVRGSTEAVAITADRDSAFVFVDGEPAGTTPLQLDLRRASRHRIAVVREGYHVGRAEIGREINPAAVVGSTLAGGLGSLAVDLSSGAVYDLDPRVHVILVPDSTGASSGTVAALTAQALAATPEDIERATEHRRRPAPWLTAQASTGVYTSGEIETPDHAGGVGGALAVGIRAGPYTARLSGTTASGLLFDNSVAWEASVLLGVVRESGSGRFRGGISAGPSLSGGLESNACFLCNGSRGPQESIPTRLGFAMLGEAYLFLTPQIGIGIQAPFAVHGDRIGRGVMLGWKFEGL